VTARREQEKCVSDWLELQIKNANKKSLVKSQTLDKLRLLNVLCSRGPIRPPLMSISAGNLCLIEASTSTAGDIIDKSDEERDEQQKKASESTKCICLFRSDRD
jgi:hypothetical protein